MNNQADDIRGRWFLWGMFLAWIPFLFIVFPAISAVFYSFRISSHKVTGLAAVAGGSFEAFAMFGLAATVAFEVGAIVLLLRAFSRGRPMRVFFSVLSICCSGLMLTIWGLSLWLFFFRPHS